MQFSSCTGSDISTWGKYRYPNDVIKTTIRLVYADFIIKSAVVFSVEKVRIVCSAKDFQIFPTKSNCGFIIFTFYFLTKRLLTTSLISTNWPLVMGPAD